MKRRSGSTLVCAGVLDDDGMVLSHVVSSTCVITALCISRSSRMKSGKDVSLSEGLMGVGRREGVRGRMVSRAVLKGGIGVGAASSGGCGTSVRALRAGEVLRDRGGVNGTANKTGAVC